MREIKFRAWNSKHKMSASFTIKDVGEYDGTTSAKWPNKTVFMQYTGLKDKNGKEIYEGDIVVTIDGVCEVIWDMGGFYVSSDIIGSPIYVHKDLDFKVIGNIYENPELL